MDKRYKKLLLTYYLYILSGCITLFISVFAIKYNMKILYPFSVAGFVSIFLTGLQVDRIQKESDWYLTVLTRKTDTAEKLKKDKVIFIVAAFTFGLVGFFGAKYTDNMLFMLLLSAYPFFSVMAGLTKKKIKYLENKPDGMNF